MAPLLRTTILVVLTKPRQPLSYVLSCKNVPSVAKAFKQSNGHPNMIMRGATLFLHLVRETSLEFSCTIGAVAKTPISYRKASRNEDDLQPESGRESPQGMH